MVQVIRIVCGNCQHHQTNFCPGINHDDPKYVPLNSTVAQTCKRFELSQGYKLFCRIGCWLHELEHCRGTVRPMNAKKTGYPARRSFIATTGKAKHLPPCHTCKQLFKTGDTVQPHYSNRVNKYYHERCWNKLFH